MSKQTQKPVKSKFETLFEAAMEDENLFQDDDVIDDYESNIDDINDEFKDEGEEGGEDVTITLSQSQVSALREILSLVDGDASEEDNEDEEGFSDGEEDEFDAFQTSDDDFEELEREAVESEKAPSPEAARNRTKSGKAEGKVKPGDLEYDSQAKDGEEKQYKFVKRQKPTELKHKTTKGS